MLKQLRAQSLPFYILFFSEFLGRFSHWGIQALLVFYLIQKLNFTDNHAYLIIGAYSSLTFTSSIVGGFLSDKIMGFKRSIFYGLSLIFIGNVVLVLSTIDSLFFGLSLVALGTGLLIPNNANLFGSLYQDTVAKAEAFNLYYIATQTGCLLGPIAYGLLEQNYGFNITFLISVALVIIWFAIYSANRAKFPKSNGANNPFKFKLTQSFPNLSFIFIGLIIITLYSLVIEDSQSVKYLLNIAGLFTLIYVLYTASKFSKKDRHRVYYLLSLIPFILVFFACAFQVTNSLLVFANQNVNKNFFGLEIPASFFASAEPIFIVILSPFISKLWDILDKKGITFNALIKILSGLFITSLSFFIFYICSRYSLSGTKVPDTLFLSGFALLGLGELLIMPSIMAAVSNNATPLQLKGTLMGSIFLSLAFSSYASSIIATLTASSGFGAVYKNLSLFLILFVVIISTARLIYKGFFIKRGE